MSESSPAGIHESLARIASALERIASAMGKDRKQDAPEQQTPFPWGEIRERYRKLGNWPDGRPKTCEDMLSTGRSRVLDRDVTRNIDVKKLVADIDKIMNGLGFGDLWLCT